MQKPTKEQIEKASDEQLAEWAAVWVMGWERVERLSAWARKPGAISPDLIHFLDWNPAQNIGQAMELIEKFKDDFSWEIHIFMNKCRCFLDGTPKGPFITIDDKIISRAITKAAIMAAMGKGG